MRFIITDAANCLHQGKELDIYKGAGYALVYPDEVNPQTNKILQLITDELGTESLSFARSAYLNRNCPKTFEASPKKGSGKYQIGLHVCPYLVDASNNFTINQEIGGRIGGIFVPIGDVLDALRAYLTDLEVSVDDQMKRNMKFVITDSSNCIHQHNSLIPFKSENYVLLYADNMNPATNKILTDVMNEFGSKSANYALSFQFFAPNSYDRSEKTGSGKHTISAHVAPYCVNNFNHFTTLPHEKRIGGIFIPVGKTLDLVKAYLEERVNLDIQTSNSNSYSNK